MRNTSDKSRRNEGKKPVIVFAAAVIISLLIIYIGHNMCIYAPESTVQENVSQAKVSKIISDETVESGHGMTRQTLVFEAELKGGENKGDTVTVTQIIDSMISPRPEPVATGDRIIVTESQVQAQPDNEGAGGTSADGTQWYYVSADRTPVSAALIIIFVLLVLIIGRLKGFTTITALFITVLAIFAVYVPAILTGRNIYIMTLLTAGFIIFSSLIILNGINRKTLCAIAGNLGGIIVAGALALVFNRLMGITGLVDEDYVFLSMLEGNVSVDLRGVVWGGIIIGSLGAIMDVAMSIASAMNELASEMKDRNYVRMVRSGMNIGRDAIGTMTNTLILAYVGSSLALILLFAAYDRNPLVLFNLEMVMVEIIQSVVGSIGILLSVPATVFFSAWIFNRKTEDDIEDFVLDGGSCHINKNSIPHSQDAQKQGGDKMKKTAVVYESHTGNTKLLADTIFELVKEAPELEAVYCGGVKDAPEDADIVFLGTWTDKGSGCAPVLEYIKTLEDKKIYVFGTAGFGGDPGYFDKIRDRILAGLPASSEAAGSFFCQGKMPMAVRERYVAMIKENPDDKSLQVSLKNFDDALSHPDENDLANLRNWFRKQEF